MSAKRILLFTGKGGVGKTSCAAASAIKAAEMGYRTLIMSSDPAHSLADALDTKLGPEPIKVADKLYAQEIDMYYSMKKYWGNIRELLLLVFKWQGINEIAAEELAAIPGMEEASALLWLNQFYHSDEYDLIIVDSAPTGETLTFLTLPQITEWWVTKAFPFQKLAVKSVGYAVRKTTGIPLDRGYKELQELLEELKGIHEVLTDPEVCSVRLVMNPEKMVIKETKRAYSYLQMYGYNVDCVIINRLIEEDLGSKWEEYLKTQKEHLYNINSSFAPLPIFKISHQLKEVFGMERLQIMADEMYVDSDPSQIFYHEPTYKVESEDDLYIIKIKLPFVEEMNCKTSQIGDQLIVQLENRRLNYFLPKFLTYFHIKESSIKDGWLCIFFEKA